jgi:hypothetical protein
MRATHMRVPTQYYIRNAHIQTLKLLTRNKPIAQVMLIGWAFAYLVEGASGFGTPVIIASRLLKELGHDAVSALCCCLVMNTLATPFGESSFQLLVLPSFHYSSVYLLCSLFFERFLCAPLDSTHPTTDSSVAQPYISVCLRCVFSSPFSLFDVVLSTKIRVPVISSPCVVCEYEQVICELPE